MQLQNPARLNQKSEEYRAIAQAMFDNDATLLYNVSRMVTSAIMLQVMKDASHTDGLAFGGNIDANDIVYVKYDFFVQCMVLGIDLEREFGVLIADEQEFDIE